jgi:phage gpG-like protein
MDTFQFSAAVRRKGVLLENYVYVHFPAVAGNITTRFINGNFRAQGWQGQTFQPWKKNKRAGTILVKRGQLRRGTYFVTQPGTAVLRNNVAYAKFHNQGFKGTVSVRAHQRRILQAQKVQTGRLTKKGRMQTRTIHKLASLGKVQAHTRKVDMPPRQFMPTSPTDSPVLMNAIRREVERGLRKIFE